MAELGVAAGSVPCPFTGCDWATPIPIRETLHLPHELRVVLDVDATATALAKHWIAVHPGPDPG